MDKGKLVQLLQASQVPDTNQVKAATAELQKNFYSKPEVLLVLVEIALTNDDSAVRQLATVQATRLLPSFWSETAQDQRELARNHLLDGTLKESSSAVRHSLARLVAGIVSLDMENGEGEAFLAKMLPLSNNDNIVAREVGSFLLYAILEEDPHHFTDHTHQLLQLFQARIEDPESKDVRINIVRAVGVALEIVDPEDQKAIKAVQSFVPSMVNILKATVEASDEESYGVVFEVFHSYITFDSSFLATHLRDLVQFMIDLAANTDADEDPRGQALAFLIQCVRFRRMKMQAMKDMGAQLIAKSMQIVTELDSDDEEEMSPARAAMTLIGTLSNELPPRQVIVPLLEQFPSYATHQDPQYRMSAMLSLGNAAEGAPDFIATQLESILPAVITLLNDAETNVRHAALVGLIHLAEEMASEMVTHHEQIISAIMKNLEAASTGPSDKKNVSIIRCSCGALDTFGDGIDTKIMAQYGPNLIGPMVRLLEHEDFGVKAGAASAIGAFASSMEDAFVPYFKDVMVSLGKFVSIKENDEAMELRSSTCDSLGRIAMAVGPEVFQPYVMDLMTASEEALHLDNPRLKETSFILWSSLSKVYKEQFDHFLPGVFKGLRASLDLADEEIEIPGLKPSQMEDGSIVIGGKKINLKSSGDDDDLEIDEDALDDINLEDLENLDAVTAVALEQEIALDVLGDVISNSCNSADLEKYVQPTVEKLLTFAEHTYEGCRKSAIATLWRIYARVFQVWEEGAGVKWEPGMPPKHTPPDSLITLGKATTKATMNIWHEDMERTVITEINRNVAATLKACGPAILAVENGIIEQIVTVIGLVITRSHPCQQDMGDEEEEADQEDAGSSEYDWLAIETALDVVTGLAAALGGDFAELWKIFEKPVVKLASSTEDLQRSAAVGYIADVLRYTGEAITPFTDSLAQVLVRRLSDPDPLTKSNAAYAIGLLMQNSTETGKTFPMYPSIWEKLEALLAIKEERMTDNVAGAVSRMISKNPDSGFVAQALPAVVGVLPLTEDFEENAPVYQCIYKLYELSNPTVEQLTPQLVGIFEQVLSPPEEQLEKETREILQRTVQVLYNAKPDLLANNPNLLKLAGLQ